MKKIILIGNIIISILILFVTVSVFLIKMPVKRQLQPDCADANGGWHYEDGTSAVLSDLQYTEHITKVSRTLEADSLAAYTLCFDTANVDFTVYMNGETIYDYHPELLPIYGESYGLDFHAVTIPYFIGEADLMIQAEDLSKGSMWAGFQNLSFENGANYIQHSLTADFFNCFLSFLIFIVGFLIVVLGLLFKNHNVQCLEMVSLGTLAMVLSMWTITRSYFLGMLTGNPGYIRVINYLTLIVLPMVGMTLVASLLKCSNSRFLYIITALTFFNLILHLVMLNGKWMDYHDLLFLTHIVFVIGVVFAIIMIIRCYHKNEIQQKRKGIIFLAFLILMSSGIAELIVYYFIQSKDASICSRIGLLIFVILLSAYEVRELVLIAQQNREVEVMRRLAYEDGLTGLENRLSFNEFEATLKQQKSGKCLFIQFDINNLKKVNDNYGHVAGDNFIKAGAGIIASSFGEYGRVFRTGGDEFISVFLVKGGDEELSDIYEKCKKQMIKQIERYNQKMDLPIPLTIAYGMAECNLEMENLEEKEILADERMYEQKRKMKSL